ncbi:hypothetical protein N802_11860 [Knoellia sinensis KCTC 19936]|uniref:OmpR/PhoB-type domain-containing protein n=1 Tax=Knoellia sinensis KCTC 19936 TaxID=1385520 RepID=A0A0A0JE82_9MICO|nr:hypothetical protein N802_11860 [Knoellia sinensis KCTC 19936]
MGVLGSVEAFAGDQPVDLGTRKQRALVAALAMHHGRPVSVDAIVDLLWSDQPPPGVNGTLQAYVAGLRRALEPDRPARAPSTVLVTVSPGYALRVAEDDLDAARFDRTVSRSHRRLGQVSQLHTPRGLTHDELRGVVADLDGALGLWRGKPYVDLDDAPDAVAERARLEELRTVALEDRAIAALELGEHATVAAELEALTATYPLRERLWGLRALALTRSGRQADALDSLREVRDVLADELGLEPSAELRDLQALVLRQDASLLWQPAPSTPSTPVTTSPVSPPPPITSYQPRLPDWPLVGRADQLTTLESALKESVAGTPALAALVGDPGIGKSRLAAELASLAVDLGVTVAVGRCSQDDGAPPLWAWQQVLRSLGRSVPDDESNDGRGQFQRWSAIVDDVRDVATGRPLLVVLEDLHWADAATLRALRLLAESMHDVRLMVLATWRGHPEPVDALADVAEAFARAFAIRLDLAGLTLEQSSEVVAAVSSTAPTRAEANALRDRTDGNPFFLVEYARLARDGGDLHSLLTEDHPPTAVHDVVVRRLQRLPHTTTQSLKWAAVVGRHFDLTTVVTASDIDEDDLLDELDTALAAGLVRDEGDGRYRFGHALVRDTLYSATPPTRRARAHARVAAAVDGVRGRETEAARHWLAGGPDHAGRAWPAAVAAATVARRLNAYEEAVDLLRRALMVMSDDPDASPRERHDVLVDLAVAQRWAGDWQGVVATAEEMIAIADLLDDVDLLAEAGTMTSVGALWQSAHHGTVNTVIVDGLRRALERLPDADGPLRCRVLLTLALELYHGSAFEERRQLVDEGMAMARRLGDDGLLLDACQLAYTSLWRPSTAVERHALITEAMHLAHRLGDERAYVVTTALCAVVAAELGLIEEMWQHAAVARDEATRLRLPYGLIVIDSLTLPWLAMAGRFEECEVLLASIASAHQQMRLTQSEDALTAAFTTLRHWQGRSAEVVPQLEGFAQRSPLPATSTLIVLLARSGELERARTFRRSHSIDLTGDDWFSMLNWCAAGEAGLWLDDPAIAAEAHERMAPYADRAASAGSGNAMGPVDMFLAQAAAAVGDRAAAAEHAERALELCDAWQIPLAAEWFRGQRDRFDF